MEVVGTLSAINVKYTAYANSTVNDKVTLSPESGGSLNTKIVRRAIRSTGKIVFSMWNSGRRRSFNV